jgi:hypothetical protein
MTDDRWQMTAKDQRNGMVTAELVLTGSLGTLQRGRCFLMHRTCREGVSGKRSSLLFTETLSLHPKRSAPRPIDCPRPPPHPLLLTFFAIFAALRENGPDFNFSLSSQPFRLDFRPCNLVTPCVTGGSKGLCLVCLCQFRIRGTR